MKYKDGQEFLFLRTSNFNNFDFIEEHNRIIKNNGYVWILKTGRKIDTNYLRQLINEDSGIIIKKSSRTDDRLFYCKLESIDYDNSNVFPDYYFDYLTYNSFRISDMNSNNSCWFKISNISLIPNDIAEKLIVSKNNNKLKNAAINSRTPSIFCKYIKGSDLKCLQKNN